MRMHFYNVAFHIMFLYLFIINCENLSELLERLKLKNYNFRLLCLDH